MESTKEEKLVQKISNEIKSLSKLWLKRKRNLILLKEGAKKIQELMKMCAVCGDTNTKEIGERVMIWDITGLTAVCNNSAFLHTERDLEMIMNSECIVVSTNETYVSIPTIYGEKAKILDLIVWNKETDRLLRTSSECVKIVQKKKKELMLRRRQKAAA
jgi:hypothetical protein